MYLEVLQQFTTSNRIAVDFLYDQVVLRKKMGGQLPQVLLKLIVDICAQRGHPSECITNIRST